MNANPEKSHSPQGSRARIAWLVPVVVLFAAAAIYLATRPASRPEAPVLMICVDGLEMSVLLPMLEAERLPNLAMLADRGVIGSLTSFAPAKSPVVWTTVATGKESRKHGITDFVDPASGGPFTSNARAVKALWNIADDSGLTSNVIGFWNTWPAEEIDGTVVSQFSSRTQRQYQNMVKGSLFRTIDGATWPPGYIETIWPLVAGATTPERLMADVSIPVFGDLRGGGWPPEIEDLVKSSFWSFEADAGYHAIARDLLSSSPADLNIVYYGGADVISHRFWRYREPGFYSYRIPDEEIAAFGEAIERYYILLDKMVGDLVALLGEETRILILSDHGMHADFADGTLDGKKTGLSAHHLDGPAGVLIAAGRGIKSGIGIGGLKGGADPVETGSVFDIAPTVLYLLDMPVGRDMRLGRVMKSIVSEEQIGLRPVRFVDSHDEGFRPATESLSSEDADKEFLDRMSRLGYLK